MPADVNHEKIINKLTPFLDIRLWLEKLSTIEAQVCRIEIKTNNGQAFGTGFLLGPDVLITNYHVMEPVIQGEQGLAAKDGSTATAEDVILRFDYKKLPGGQVINPGKEYRLADEWLIDKSPYAAVYSAPEADELDYVLLRVRDKPGCAHIGGLGDAELSPRGWIQIPSEAYDFQPDTPLFIVQHPRKRPLKLALETNAIIGLNSNRTSVKYRTNTEPGSSGSPCFNAKLELVALHHSGDPDWLHPEYNAGTPFEAILKLLEQRGLRGVLGGSC